MDEIVNNTKFCTFFCILENPYWNIKLIIIFSEMLSHWKVIVKVDGDQLTLITGSSKNLKMEVVTKQDFTKRCQYGHIEGYWIDFMKNDTSRASDYLDAYCEGLSMSVEDIRELKLDLVL